jgi:PAS domain S-box-containing protein
MAPDRAGTREERTRDQYLRLILGQVAGVIWAVDRDLRLTHVQGQVVGIGHLDSRRILGRPLQNLVGTRDPTEPAIEHHLAALSGKIESFEYVYFDRFYDVRIEPLRDADGEIAGCIGTAVDFTSRLASGEPTLRRRRPQAIANIGQGVAPDPRDSDEELRRSVSLLTATFEASADGLLVMDGDGNIAAYNQQFLSLWRIPPDVASSPEAVRLHVLDQIEEPNEVLRAIRKLSGLPDNEGFDLVRTKDGRLFERYSSPRHPGTAFVGRVWSFRDVTAQKKMEATLRESAARLELAVQAAHVGLWDWDLRTNQVFFSAEWKRQIGYADHEIGNSLAEWHERIHPEDRHRTLQTVQAFIAKPWPGYTLEFRIRHKDGSYRWILTQASLVQDESGTPIRMLGSHVDITDRKRQEEAQQSAHRHRAAILESVSDAFVALDHDWRYTYVNRRAGEMFGREPEDLIGKHIWTEFPEGLGLEFQRAYERSVVDRVPIQLEEFYPPWGRWYENRIYPSDDGVAIYFTEITDRKRAEALLEGQRNVLEMIALGASLEETLVALVRLIEAQSTEMLGSILVIEPDGIHVRHGAAPSLPASFIQAIDGSAIGERAGSCGTAAYRGELVITEDIATDPLWEGYRHLALPYGLRACWSTPIFDGQRRVIGTFALYVRRPARPTEPDLQLMQIATHTASIAICRKREDEELRELNAELEARVVERTRSLEAAMREAQSADLLKSAFLATMSHELRTPLNSIIGFTGVLMRGLAGPLNDEQIKQLGMARESANRLLALINDVLDISKIEAGQLEVIRTPLDIRVIIESVLRSVAPHAHKKGLALSAAIGPEVGTIVSDRRRVEQILLNLLSNGVKFTERGEVRLECRVRGAFLETSVCDTGIGIPAEDMDRLFKPFQQLETGLDRRHEGTGLGLSICQNLTRLLGGSIQAESALGAGSRFTFTLPLFSPDLKVGPAAGVSELKAGPTTAAG